MPQKKKVLKNLAVFVICLMVLAILQTLFYHIKTRRLTQYENSPDKRAGWEWVSEDGNVSIYTVNVDGRNKVFGTIRSNGEEIPIAIRIHGGDMIVTGLNEYSSNDGPIEIWFGEFIKPDEFIIEVTKTTYLTVGQKMNFYRVID